MSSLQENFKRRVIYLCKLIDSKRCDAKIMDYFCLLINDIDVYASSFCVCKKQWKKILDFMQTKLEEHSSSSDSEEYERVFVHLALSYSLLKNKIKYNTQKLSPKHYLVIGRRELETGNKNFIKCVEHDKEFHVAITLYKHIRNHHPEAYINENSDEEFEVSVHECNENDPEKCDDVNQRTSLTLNDNETCDGDIQMTSPPLNDSETCDEDIQMIFDPNNNEYLNSVDEFDDLDSESTDTASETNQYDEEFLSDIDEDFDSDSNEKEESIFFETLSSTLSTQNMKRFENYALKIIDTRISRNTSLVGLREITDQCFDLASELIMDDTLTNRDRLDILNTSKRFSRSLHLQNVCLKRSDNFIKPIKYEKDGIKFYYMPLKKIIKSLVDEDIIQNTLNERSENTSTYIKENNLVGKIRLILYADDIGVVNPIGFAKGRHKMLLFHLDIDNPTKWKTKADSIPSVLMVERSSSLKATGLKIILEPMFEDLKHLAQNGIYFRNHNTTLLVQLAYVIGDNLSVAELLGFKRTFGKYLTCRYCSATRAEIEAPDFFSLPRRQENFLLPPSILSNEIDQIKTNKQYKSPFGIKFPSPFLDLGMNIFKISPPDIFHDFLEGVLPDVVQVIAQKSGIRKKNLISRIKQIKWVNGPVSVINQLEICGNAVQKLEFFFRLIEIYPEWLNNPPNIFPLYEVARKTVFKICSPSSIYDYSLFRSEVEKFVEMMKINEIKRAKAHFISHYPSLVGFYGGSLVSYSSRRFERKNKEVKNLILHSRNFKDVAYSLSWLHQAKRITVKKTAPESWPLNRNIVRAIVQGESEEAISFIKANELKTVDDKILVLGDKFDTTITNLYFVRKVINVERDYRIFLDQTSYNNSFIFSNDEFVNYCIQV
ncbi:uncharacterized protein LOC124497686 [Dermatophagoides farinae]|uniref:uncharacterized protein LOC124497686 n=1 Tax=Dermatophagoides farinae TaxID=6954 RepID=UPI003F62E78E